MAPTLGSLEEGVEALIRGQATDLTAYLHEVETRIRHHGTEATLHCYSLALDGTSLPRVDGLAKALCMRVVDYAIPRSEIVRARSYDHKHNTTTATAELVAKAKALFAPVKQSGEGGELLLYMLVQSYLGHPQLFCKMPHKTNPNMHVHGIDGIHCGVSGDGDLILYWGESKLYKSIGSAVAECLDSLKPFVCDGEANGQRSRDLQLLRSNIDLDNPALTGALLRYLNPDDPMFNKTKNEGVCLIGFDSDAYPATPHSKTIDTLIAELKTALAAWKPLVGGHVVKRPPMERIKLDIFLLPFPSVEAFRAAFLREIGK